MRRALLLLAAIAAASSCGRTGMLQEDGFAPGGLLPPDAKLPEPQPDPTPLIFGDGHTGAFALTTGTDRVNDCQVLETASGTSLTVSGGPVFEVGDVVLVWNVQGISDTAGPTEDVTFAGDIGRWEMARVSSIGGSGSATLETPLAFSYATAGEQVAQLCNVPEFTDVTITDGTLEAQAWDGQRGGVIAFFVSGTLTVDAPGLISADARGFRGGNQSQRNNVQDVVAETTNNNSGGNKGEGLDSTSLTLFGRGAMTNSGGGGNGLNAGGGGGGLGGQGGFGGKQLEGAGDDANTRGRPGGAVLAAPRERLSFGGGGGAGHDDTDNSFDGGSGGGVVIIVANAITGGGDIRSRGASAQDGTDDGQGGGGAGGTILMRAGSSDYTGTLDAIGGDGGNAQTGSRHGPGGGGAGGIIAVMGLATNGGAVTLTGGQCGGTTNSANDDWGASDGQPGRIAPY